MSKTKQAIGFFGLLIIVGVIVALSGPLKSNASASDSPTGPSDKADVTYAPGSPAVVPQMNNAIPSYTVKDVEQYVKTKSVYAHTLTSMQVMFITADEASLRLHGEFTDRPDKTLVCYVELQGSFMPTGPLPYNAKPTASDTADMVFDAQTGTLLLWGP